MTTNEALDQYLQSLPTKERIAKSRDLRESLKISRYVLSDWRRGRTNLDSVYFSKVQEVLGVDLQNNVEF